MKPNKISKNEISAEKGLEILKEALVMSMLQEFEQYDDSCDFEFSDNFKRKMNKIFCEAVGPDRIPYPEVEKRLTNQEQALCLKKTKTTVV